MVRPIRTSSHYRSLASKGRNASSVEADTWAVAARQTASAALEESGRTMLTGVFQSGAARRCCEPWQRYVFIQMKDTGAFRTRRFWPRGPESCLTDDERVNHDPNAYENGSKEWRSQPRWLALFLAGASAFNRLSNGLKQLESKVEGATLHAWP